MRVVLNFLPKTFTVRENTYYPEGRNSRNGTKGPENNHYIAKARNTELPEEVAKKILGKHWPHIQVSSQLTSSVHRSGPGTDLVFVFLGNATET